MKRSMMMLAILTLVLVAGAAQADAVVQARSDVPARVFVDGAFVGVSPIDVVIPRRGTHEVRFRARGSRQDRSFLVQVPGRSRIVTPLFANLAQFYAPVAPVVVASPVIVTQPVIYARSPYGYRGGRGRFWR